MARHHRHARPIVRRRHTRRLVRRRHVRTLGQRQPRRAAQAAPAASASGPVCDSKSLVRDALAYRGVPYRYAGMSSRGIDCSGLVARVLQAQGIRAPHNAASLFRMGTPVSYQDLKAGDLVFFNTRGSGVSHVGIYMGNDKFVHASSGSGYVTVTHLSDPYYQRRLVGARRLTRG